MRLVSLLVIALSFAAVACRVDLAETATPVGDFVEQELAADEQPAPNQSAETPDASADQESATDDADPIDSSDTTIDGLPVLGPVPGRSHWHAAYVVRVCDQVFDPFDSTDDPLGIHSHADGLVHVHPFTAAAGFENATLDVFASAMGFEIKEGELRLPSGVIWRDGDTCDTSRGRVFVDRWSGPGFDGEPERIFEDLDSIRFEADREIYQIAFAPEDSAPVVPPSVDQLSNVSAPVVVDELWVDIDPAADLATVKMWTVASVTEPPCADGDISERSLTGTPGCFKPTGEQFERSQAVSGARAVSFNRRAAVELTLTDEFRRHLAGRLRTSESAAVAIEVSGEVVYAIAYDAAAIDDDLLIIRGGLDAKAARALARLFAI